VQDLRKVFERAKARRDHGRGTLLLVDKIHRFNTAQQSTLVTRPSKPANDESRAASAVLDDQLQINIR